MGSAEAQKSLEAWLGRQKCDIFATQEPWSHRRRLPIILGFMDAVGGNSQTFCWGSSASAERANSRQRRTNWQEIEFGEFKLYNVYLPSSSEAGKGRASALVALLSSIRTSGDKPVIVVGDFNLAPDVESGVYCERRSDWTSRLERTAFDELLKSGGLVDTTARANLGCVAFSYEKRLKGKMLRFRCDLALVSASIVSLVTACYDHSVRTSSMGFTDHSAVIVDVHWPTASEDTSYAPIPDR